MITLGVLPRLAFRSLAQRKLARSSMLWTILRCIGSADSSSGAVQIPVLGHPMKVWSTRELLDILQHNYLGLTCYLDLEDIRTIVDGGAHVGLITLLFREIYPSATIHSFEPDPANIEMLRDNVGRLPGVHVHHAALGAPGVRTARFFRQQSQTGTLQVELRAEASDREVEVSVVDARGVLDIAEPIDLLKLDIEGAEYDFLEGLDLAQQPARHMYIEFHTSGLNEFPRIQAFLNRAAPFYEKRFEHVTTYAELGLFVYEVLLSRRAGSVAPSGPLA